MKLRNGSLHPLHEVAEAVLQLEALAQRDNGKQLTKDLYRLAADHQSEWVSQKHRELFADLGLLQLAEEGKPATVRPIIRDVLVSSTRSLTEDLHGAVHNASPFGSDDMAVRLHRALHPVERAR